MRPCTRGHLLHAVHPPFVREECIGSLGQVLRVQSKATWLSFKSRHKYVSVPGASLWEETVNNNLGLFIIYSRPRSSVNYAALQYAWLLPCMEPPLQTAIPVGESRAPANCTRRAVSPFLAMLHGPWLNACIPHTQCLCDESLDTWRQKDRPGVRPDQEGAFLSLPSMKASKHPSMGLPGRECSSLSCSGGG